VARSREDLSRELAGWDIKSPPAEGAALCPVISEGRSSIDELVFSISVNVGSLNVSSGVFCHDTEFP